MLFKGSRPSIKKYYKTLLVFFLLLPLPQSIKSEDLRKTVITDPAISRRCDALINQRQQKVDHKQKLLQLIERSKRLVKITPPERATLIRSLEKTHKGLIRELKLTLNQIQNREESIVRKGCPGITLSE